MRPAFLVLAALLAGCAAPAAPPGVPGLPNTGGWSLDCGWVAPPDWAQRCMVQASHTEGPKQEMWLAVDPNDPDRVAIDVKDDNPESSADCVWNGVFVTHDGGETWADVTIGGKYADRQPGDPYYGFACNTDPMLAFSADGTLHAVVEMYGFGGSDAFGPLGLNLFQTGWKVVLATSHDGGLTWPDATTLLIGDGVAVMHDFNRLVPSPATGTLLTAIGSFNGLAYAQRGALYAACSTIASRDGGRTAELPVEVLASGAPGSLRCRALAASPTGTYVMGLKETDPTSEHNLFENGHLWFARSVDDGRSFSDPRLEFDYAPLPRRFEGTEARPGTNVELAYDLSAGPRRGMLYVMYADLSQGHGDVLARSSRDDGASWSEPVRVNDDGGNHHQFMPNLVVARDGSIHAFFMDKRWDPENRLLDVTHAVSLDGGQTWANERVTTVSFDGDLGRHQTGAPFIGDYLGIGTSGDVVWGGFPDASNGETAVAAAARVVSAGG